MRNFFDKNIKVELLFKGTRDGFDGGNKYFETLFKRKNILYIVKSGFNKTFGAFVAA